jgi:hypothetical protein
MVLNLVLPHLVLPQPVLPQPVLPQPVLPRPVLPRGPTGRADDAIASPSRRGVSWPSRARAKQADPPAWVRRLREMTGARPVMTGRNRRHRRQIVVLMRIPS